MLQRFRAGGLIWPTICALGALAALLALGTWQMQRKAWKDGLQRQITERARASPMAISNSAAFAGLSEYARVSIAGRFLHDAERYYYAPDPKMGPGYHVYTPLLLTDDRIVMVNRGAVPEELKGVACVLLLIQFPLIVMAKAPAFSWAPEDNCMLLSTVTAPASDFIPDPELATYKL